jgi:hypothetical protein
MIDTKSRYVYVEHITTDPILTVHYIYIQYTDNETQVEELYDKLEILHDNLGTNHSITMYIQPLKGTTVADITDDIPAIVLTGRLRDISTISITEEMFTQPDKLYNLLENKSTIEQFIPDFYDKED